MDAKSILSVLTLGVEKDHEIELSAEGEDEVQAVQSLRELIENSKKKWEAAECFPLSFVYGIIAVELRQD